MLSGDSRPQNLREEIGKSLSSYRKSWDGNPNYNLTESEITDHLLALFERMAKEVIGEDEAIVSFNMIEDWKDADAQDHGIVRNELKDFQRQRLAELLRQGKESV